MPSCMVCGRSDNRSSKAASISFHRFPSKECVRVKWNNFLLNNSLNPVDVIKSSLVCSLHFDKSCFILHKSRKLLQKHAVPSIIVGRIKNTKQLYPETLNHLTHDVETDSSISLISSNSSTENILSFNRKLVTISGSNLQVEGVSPLNEPIASSISCTTSSVVEVQKETETIETSFIGASKVSNDDTPRRMFLKRGIRQLSSELIIKNKKMKSLQQVVRCQNKKIANLKTIIEDLKKRNLIDEDISVTLLESFGKYQNLITNWAKKNAGKTVPKKYSPTVRQFALSLHFCSAKAYEYVRSQFNTVLPHPRTLSKWYRHVNAEPGFTEESLKALTLKVKHSPHTIFAALIMDEMSIRQHLEYDGNQYYGRIDMGTEMNNDSLEMAKECFVFLIVSVNENWKLPIGYFLCSSLKSAQKVELIRHALHVLESTGIKIISLTFDSCSTNITAAKLLGCKYDIDTLSTSFASENNTNIVTMLDPAHIIKLVRNAFGEKKIFIDHKNRTVNFEYIQKLCCLQEEEGCHLANKLRKQHLFYFKQKMKVKLATQLLSQSVADSLKFCKDNLQIEEFLHADATIEFIEIFNIGFDILNSRSINCIGFKKALCKENMEEIKLFTDKITFYIKNLKIQNQNGVFIPILQSNRKTGFIGFIICLNSILELSQNSSQ